MSFLLSCPTCGERRVTEFVFLGELPDGVTGRETDLEEAYVRAWMPQNVRGPQRERWFHADGCRRVVAIVRDTETNRMVSERA